MRSNIKELIDKMSLEEKAGLCSGRDNWQTKAIEHLKIPSIWLTDGPHGLRKQEGDQDHLGINESNVATCFPTACSTAASFDPDLLYEMGKELGAQSRKENIQILLGPGINIKRSPLCGRNFEYFSEDPLVSSELGKSFVKGVQEQGIGTSLKHFLANNQEHRRNTSSSNVDERSLREIYMRAFEKVIKEAKPWSIMSSYNKINGVFASENEYFLSTILRDEWGFEGAVVSDWGAVHSRVAAIEAGCDLVMPANIETDHEIIQAVQNGVLEEDKLNKACERILNLIFKSQERENKESSNHFEKAHKFSQKIAEESIVLLKNEETILPLKKSQKIAFIGNFAENPRYQGSGSSRVNSWRVSSALSAVHKKLDVTYAEGYTLNSEDDKDLNLRKEAVRIAKDMDVIVFFAGLTEEMESEGFDRKHMRMPENQNILIKEISNVQPNIVVILHNGGPIEMPWINNVKGILETYLGGEAIGNAIIRTLFGEVNPSGRLPETFPLRLKDTPSYLSYPGEGDQVDYQEGIFVGYRYYTTKDIEVLFPFGFGLSYTNFNYSNLKIDKKNATAKDKIIVSVDVENTGASSGKEVIQLYIGKEWQALGVHRPLRELRSFKKVFLESGEIVTVTFELDKDAFSYWDISVHDWRVDGGIYQIQIGKSVNEIVLSEDINMEDEYIHKNEKITMLSTIGIVYRHRIGKKFIDEIKPIMIQNLIQMGFVQEEQAFNKMEDMQTMNELPLTVVKGFLPHIENDEWENLLRELNKSNLYLE